jgi:hypothetical protein
MRLPCVLALAGLAVLGGVGSCAEPVPDRGGKTPARADLAAAAGAGQGRQVSCKALFRGTLPSAVALADDGGKVDTGE